MKQDNNLSRYDEVIVMLFQRLRRKYGNTANRLEFDKEFLDEFAAELRIKNVPDIIYSFRSGRREFPTSMTEQGNWVITGRGKGKYAFEILEGEKHFVLPDLDITPIPDATPEIVMKYAKGDEQATLVQIRYNRLVEIFTGLTAFHLQSHIRAYVENLGQVEIDDLYVGVNTDGTWYCLPLEAKSAAKFEQLGRVQIAAMVAYAQQEFGDLAIRPIGVKKLPDGSMLFVEFISESNPTLLKTRFFKRYQLFREG